MVTKKEIFRALELLAKTDPVECQTDFEENLLNTIEQLGEDTNLRSILSLKCLKTICKDMFFINFNISSRIWKFVCLSLECLVLLKQQLKKEDNEEETLISIGHQRLIRTLLERVIAAGLLSNLLSGSEHPSLNPFVNLKTSFTDLQKYGSICLVTTILIDLVHDDTLHGIILPQFLCSLLCGLCQLTMVPLKKSTDNFVQLQSERMIFEQHLDELVTKLYKPMIIKELMKIEGNKKNPRWLKRGVGKLLTRLLHQPNGVLTIIQAVRDAADCSAPATQSHLLSIAQVITASPELNNICSQILQLLDSDDAGIVQMAVLCIRTLQNKDSRACDAYLFGPMTRPLFCSLSEEALSLCLLRLQKCFTIPASDFWCLSSQLLLPNIYILFHMYCKINQSISHIKKTVEDLIWCFLSECDDSLLPDILCCLVYRERISGIRMLDGIEFTFSDGGGIKLTQTKTANYSLEDFCNCLMILLERKDIKGLLGNKIFVILLGFVTIDKDINVVDLFERELVTVKMLAVLSENSLVQEGLCKNPEPITKFLKLMIDNFIIGTFDVKEILSIALVLLNLILNYFVCSKKVCFKVFDKLQEPLSQLIRKTNNAELQLLANEAYEAIMTHGAVKPNMNIGKLDKKEDEFSSGTDNPCRKYSDCEVALEEACDPLIPVRGHAIIQLGRLLSAGNKQAKAKKEQILCIFQENLKHEDSFLYLSAIEGLVTAALEFPDTVLLCLTEQYGRSTLKPDQRLKVGEALVRVIKLLGEMVPVYKAELINIFLLGTRDNDFLVRASSLSNLGELCRVLGFRVGPIITEVLLCVHCVITSDPSIEVRRAAVMLIHLLFKGLQQDIVTVLQDILLKLYQSLKCIYSSDKDDVIRLHAQLALEELNTGTMAFLFPKPNLSKQIYVLDPPS